MKLRKFSQGNHPNLPQYPIKQPKTSESLINPHQKSPQAILQPLHKLETKSQTLSQPNKSHLKDHLTPNHPNNNPPTSISKIIESYEQLFKGLTQKISQLTTDLQLTRQKLTITETRYTTILSYMNENQKINTAGLADRIDQLQKMLIHKNAQLVRCKAKLLKKDCNSDKMKIQGQQSFDVAVIQRNNLSTYFNFLTMRQDQQIINKIRKNSAQEQDNSQNWQKALQNFADQASSPTKFKQKTISILKKFIPYEQRARVWPYIFENHLGINNQLYIQLLQRKSKNSIQSHIVSQIQRDILRSFNSKIHIKNRQILSTQVQEILQIFHLLRPDISYVQGMTYPVIVLTIVVGKIEAFKIFSNLVIGNKFFRNMYSIQEKSVEIYSKTFDTLLKQNNPTVARHLQNLKIRSQIFLIQWFFTLFSRGLSLETTLKIWDLLGYQKQVILYRLALSIFQLIGKRLLSENYEQTVGLIQSYWSYVDENMLLDATVGNKLTAERLSRTLSKVTKQVYSKDNSKDISKE